MSNFSMCFVACGSSLSTGLSAASTCGPEGLRETKPEGADTALAASSPFPDWISIVVEIVSHLPFPFRSVLGGEVYCVWWSGRKWGRERDIEEGEETEMRMQDGAGGPLGLRLFLGCARTRAGYRKEEEKGKGSQRNKNVSLPPKPSNYTHSHLNKLKAMKRTLRLKIWCQAKTQQKRKNSEDAKVCRSEVSHRVRSCWMWLSKARITLTQIKMGRVIYFNVASTCTSLCRTWSKATQTHFIFHPCSLHLSTSETTMSWKTQKDHF